MELDRDRDEMDVAPESNHPLFPCYDVCRVFFILDDSILAFQSEHNYTLMDISMSHLSISNLQYSSHSQKIS